MAHRTHKRVSSLQFPPTLKTLKETDSLNLQPEDNEHQTQQQQQQRTSSLKKASSKYTPSSPLTLPHERNSSSVKKLKGNSTRPPTHKRVSSLKEEYGSSHRRFDFSHASPPQPYRKSTMSSNSEQMPLYSGGGGGSPAKSKDYNNSSNNSNGDNHSLSREPETTPLLGFMPSEYYTTATGDNHNYNQNPFISSSLEEDIEAYPGNNGNTYAARKGSIFTADLDDFGGNTHYNSTATTTIDDNASTMSFLTSGRPLRRMNSASPNSPNGASAKKMVESFDYDPFESRVNQQFELEQTEEKIRDMDLGRWIMTFWIGVMTALIACFIERGCDLLCSLRSSALSVTIGMEKHNSSDASFIGAFAAYSLISCGFVLVAAYCAAIVCPVSAGSGIPEIKATLNGIKIHRVVRLQTLFCKAFGVLFSVAGGLPVGKEGPMVHSGAVVGSLLSQGQWSKSGFAVSCAQLKDFRNDREKRDFISCGAAAGVAAAFGAPIGGVLFVLEEGASFWHQQLTFQTFFGAMVTAFTLHMVNTFTGSKSSWNWGIMGTQGGTFSFGNFDGSKHFAAWEVLLFIAIGAIGGLFGALFNDANTKLTKFRMKYITNRWLKLCEALLVAFCMAAVSFWSPYYFGSCLPKSGPFSEDLVQMYCKTGEYNDLASLYTVYYGTSIKQLLHFTDSALVSFTPLSLIMFFIPFYIMACWTYGISVPSGLFVPSLLSGAAFGRLCVYFIHWLEIPIIAPDSMFALIGAAAMLGGMARMTISLTVILLECTGVIEWGLPIMVTLMAARWVGNSFNEGLYDIHIDLKKLPFLHAETPFYSRYLRAQNIMSCNPITINHITRVGEVYKLLKSSEHSCFPVVEEQIEDENRFGPSKFVGVILRKHLCVLLQKKDFLTDRPVPYLRKPAEGDTTLLHNRLYALNYRDIEASYPRYPQINEIKLNYEERQLWMDLTPYMNATPLAVNQQTPVTRVYRLFRSLGLRHLMVVDHSNEICGIVSRKDLTTHHMEHCLRRLSDADKIHIQGYTTFFRSSNNGPSSSASSCSVATKSNNSSKKRPQLLNESADNLSQHTPLMPQVQQQNVHEPDFQAPQLRQGYFSNRERSGTACSDLTEITSFNETYEDP